MANTTAKLSKINFMSEKKFNSLETTDNNELYAVRNNGNSLDYRNITNCIIENPKLVDLQIINTVLTLKAGSTVIVPYGRSAPTMSIGDALNGGTISDISWDGFKLFYYVTYNQDSTRATGTGNTIRQMLSLDTNGIIQWSQPSNHYSQDTAPTGGTYMHWYDTANNIFKRTNDGGSTWISYWSFPFALATTGATSDDPWTSIDQVFNSIGYVGATHWVGKGLKALMPNGRNPDGSLKNYIYTKEFTTTYSYAGDNYYVGLFLLANNLRNADLYDIFRAFTVYEQEEPPAVTNAISIWYNPVENQTYLSWGNQGFSDWTPILAVYLGDYLSDSNKVVDSIPRQVFQALDKDPLYIAHQAMPSSRYVSLTIAASGTKYKAPADGFVVSYAKVSNATSLYVSYLLNSTTRVSTMTSSYAYSSGGGWVPVRKGDSFQATYESNAKPQELLFIYAEGVK